MASIIRKDTWLKHGKGLVAAAVILYSIPKYAGV
jgi:hypothetical protein